jgi:Flp pilus assembly protein TadG
MRSSLQDARRRERRGSALVEFALVGTFIFLPLLAGLATVGMSMTTAMQAANLNASAGQMFSYGVDFTQGANVNILQTMAGSLQTSTSGGGVVILSKIDDTTSNGYVCSNQITITIGTGGNGGTSQYCSGGAATPPFTMVPGQTAYVAETYYTPPQSFNWAFAPAGTGKKPAIYEKAIF